MGWTTGVGGWDNGKDTYAVSVTMQKEPGAIKGHFTSNPATRVFFHYDVSSGTPELIWSHAIESSVRKHSLMSIGWMSEHQLRSIPFSNKMNPQEMDRIQAFIEQRLWGAGLDWDHSLETDQSET